MRLGIQQRLLPDFRGPLYDAIAQNNSGPVEVFAGFPDAGEGIKRAEGLEHANWRVCQNRRFAIGDQRAYWQPNFIDWLRTFRPEVLLVESNPRILSNYSGLSRARKLGIAVIGWGIGVMGNARDRGCYGMVMRRYFRQFDGMIAYGTKGAEDFGNLGVNPDRIFVARNSVSTKKIDEVLENSNHAEAIVQQFRARYKLTDKPVILYLGRMITEKKVDVLLDAIASIGIDCQLLLVGDGPSRPALEREAKQRNLAATFTGHLKGCNLVSAILASDLCVLPGRGGLAIQEVMAAGIPVIAGIADGTQQDLIKQGVTGFHLNEGSAIDLASLIAECLAVPEQLKEIGRAARELVQREHNLDKAVDSVFIAIQSIKENECRNP